MLAAGCADTALRREVTLDHVEAGAYSSLHSRAFLVIESAAAFARWYRDLHVHRLPPPAVPGIDFRRRLAVIALMGQRPSGGYGIRFSDSVSVQGDESVEVTIIERQPASGTMQTAVVTSPYAIATIGRGSVAKVAFVGADGQVLAVRRVNAPDRE